MNKKTDCNLRIEMVYDLINAFKLLKTPTQVADFLEDLLTPTEVRNLSVRLRIAKYLLNGGSQREIATALKVSLTTTNKVNNWLQKSGKGFRSVIKNLPLKVNIPNKKIKGPVEFHLPEVILETTLCDFCFSRKNSQKAYKNIFEK